mmetsp:Transcript_39321/g.82483  ORF Transcript_39321/g.82483 Transcript_39321/m.82483 type:complete len:208 (-) Transcript_39321:381-1004(-)
MSFQNVGGIDCALAVTPRAVSLIRSPQAVHTALARRFVGKDVVEIGTRNSGDAAECISYIASKFIAIEAEKPYCTTLLERAKELRPKTGHSFTVLCQDYTVGVPRDIDYVYWLQEGPSFNSRQVLDSLLYQHAKRPFRSGAQAIAIFDLKEDDDRKGWQAVRGAAKWAERIIFDARELCEQNQQNRPICRAHGNGSFLIAGFAISPS